VLKDNDGWVMSPFHVRRKVVDYCTNHFADASWNRLKLDGVDFDSLTIEDNDFLVAPFSIMEIEAVVKESDGEKCL